MSLCLKKEWSKTGEKDGVESKGVYSFTIKEQTFLDKVGGTNIYKSNASLYLASMCSNNQMCMPYVDLGGGVWLIFCVNLLILGFNRELVLRGFLEVLEKVTFPLPHPLHGSCQLLRVSLPPAGFVENLE